MNPETPLLTQTRQFTESVLVPLPTTYAYHNHKHTQAVVQATIAIGRGGGLTDAELETVLLAAWMHDLGYASIGQKGHEVQSAAEAREFLQKKAVSEERIRLVEGCILATRVPQEPQNRLEEVLCDADMYHLASNDGLDRSEDLRQEFSNFSGKIGKKKWLRINIDFYNQHHYFTDYARQHYEAGKQYNLEKIKRKLAKREAEELDTEDGEQGDGRAGQGANLPGATSREQGVDAFSTVTPAPSPKLPAAKRPDRGIETMFRVTSQNQIQLSMQADNKANIMISVNTIIISVILSVLIRKLEEWPNLIVPTVMLVATCLAATIFAILATRPNVIRGKFTAEDVHNKTVNLLFFGNFSRMKLEDYEWGMREMMANSDFLYNSMIRDNYVLGKVLDRKYRLLRLAYTVFMYGFVASVLAFAVASIFFV